MGFSNGDFRNLFHQGARYHVITNDNWDASEIAALFFAAGIENDEKCIYLAEQPDWRKLGDELGKLGIDTAALIYSGVLEILSPSKISPGKKPLSGIRDRFYAAVECLGKEYKGIRIICGGRYSAEFVIDNCHEDGSYVFNGYPLSYLAMYNTDRYGADNLIRLMDMPFSFIYRCGGEVNVYDGKSGYSSEDMLKLFKNVLKYLLIERQNTIRENGILRTFNSLASDFLYNYDPRETMTLILEKVMEACMADMGTIRIMKNGFLKIDSDIIVTSRMVKELSGSDNRGFDEICFFIREAAGRGEYFCCDKDDSDIPELIKSLMDGCGINSIIEVPVILEGRTLGCLTLAAVKKGCSFKRQHEFLKDSLMDASSILYRQIQLHSMYREASDVQKMKALGVLTSGMAHEFNNLLTPILGFAQIIKSRTKDPDIMMYAETIESSAKDGAMVVRRIQEFTRREDSMSRVKVDVDEVVSKAIDMTQLKWRNESNMLGKKISVVRSLNSHGFILANPTEIREVIINLILNAIDAVENEGEIKVESLSDGDNVYITVEDDGIGMSDEIAQNVFIPFFTTKKERGTGLGLSIVYNIVNDHGGTIDISSRPNNGTTVTIGLPLLSGGGEKDYEGTELLGGLNGAVIVVDDQENVSRTAAYLLEKLGFTVDTISDAENALESIKIKKCDIAVCDLAMPVMTGIDLAREIKSISPDTKIILMTGWTGGILKDGTRYYDSILKKPFTMQSVYEAVKNCTIRK